MALATILSLVAAALELGARARLLARRRRSTARARSVCRSCSRCGSSATPTSSSSPASSPHADLGTYHLASRAAFLVAVLPGGYRKALRPLQKTPMFKAVEDEYGVGTARGIQFGYFWVMLIGTLLADHARRPHPAPGRAGVLRRLGAADPADRGRPRRADRLPDDQQVGQVRRQAGPVHHRRGLRGRPVRRPLVRCSCRRLGVIGTPLAMIARLPAARGLHLLPLAARPQPDPDAVADDPRLARQRPRDRGAAHARHRRRARSCRP